MNMWKKVLLSIALISVAVGVSLAGFFYISVLGNPITKIIAKKEAKTYMKENYPNFENIEVNKVNFDWKTEYYYVDIMVNTTKGKVEYKNGKVNVDLFKSDLRFQEMDKIKKVLDHIKPNKIKTLSARVTNIDTRGLTSFDNIKNIHIDLELFIKESKYLSKEELTNLLSVTHNELENSGYIIDNYGIEYDAKCYGKRKNYKLKSSDLVNKQFDELNTIIQDRDKYMVKYNMKYTD